jgi:hypothetical protein
MYIPTENRLGLPAIGSSSTTALVDPGTIIRARDPIYGSGEFIYLLGVASTILGSAVTWGGNSSGTPTFQTALASPSGTLANRAAPIAFATSANLAGNWGWYQTSGQVVAATNGTLAAGPGPVFISATAGQVTSAIVAGAQILNAINVTATGTPAANQAVISVDRPFAQGQIT